MNYQKIYISIIENAKYKKINHNIAYEIHHIIPKCCHGSNDKSNLIKLTCKEHFIVHRLLPYIYANTEFEYPLLCAIWRMSHSPKYKKLITSKSYQIIRNKRLNKKIPFKTRLKMHFGQLGKKHSKESNKKISNANKGTVMCNNGLRNFQLHEPIPQNLCKGCIKKIPPKGMIWIHNDIQSILISISDPLPINYTYGYVSQKKLLNYKPKRKYVTNGKHNIKIDINDPIPKGYKIGITRNLIYIKKPMSKQQRSQKIKKQLIGRVWANDGKHNIFQYPDKIPSNYKRGKIKGKIWVNNGFKTILVYPNAIPNGFIKGPLKRK